MNNTLQAEDFLYFTMIALVVRVFINIVAIEYCVLYDIF
jgi:hypothetical protein